MSVLIILRKRGDFKMSKLPIERLLKDHVLTIGSEEYQLRKVTEEELLNIRMENKPGVVLCYQNEIWYSKLSSPKIKLNGQKWLEHSCSRGQDCCNHLSALPDSEGGCKCIRDTSAQYYMNRRWSTIESYRESFRIEKYDFLECALESFGTVENGFKALKCKNARYDHYKPVQFDTAILRQKLVDLAQHLNPDINSMSDIIKKF